jgi:hypothetical protein
MDPHFYFMQLLVMPWPSCPAEVQLLRRERKPARGRVETRGQLVATPG